MWEPLATRLDTHAQAEEDIFYPVLLKKGGEGGDPEDEAEDAITDHNEIRDAVRASREHEVGSEQWWRGRQQGPRGERRAPRGGGARGAHRRRQEPDPRPAARPGDAVADLLRRAPGREGRRRLRQGRRGLHRGEQLGSAHSHSMVPGGLLVMSTATRLTSSTSLVIRVEMVSSTSYGSRAQSAVIASSEVTGRSTTGWP